MALLQLSLLVAANDTADAATLASPNCSLVARLPPVAPAPLPAAACLQEELAQVRGEREGDAQEYERRLQEAVDSAEKWKQFAEGVQAREAALGEQLAAAQAELQVGRGVR